MTEATPTVRSDIGMCGMSGTQLDAVLKEAQDRPLRGLSRIGRSSEVSRHNEGGADFRSRLCHFQRAFDV